MAILTYPLKPIRKDPQVILHKIRDKKDQSSHVYLRFFLVTLATVWSSLRDSRETVNEIELVYW